MAIDTALWTIDDFHIILSAEMVRLAVLSILFPPQT